jgi:hypothetical protein
MRNTLSPLASNDLLGIAGNQGCRDRDVPRLTIKPHNAPTIVPSEAPMKAATDTHCAISEKSDSHISRTHELMPKIKAPANVPINVMRTNRFIMMGRESSFQLTIDAQR